MGGTTPYRPGLILNGSFEIAGAGGADIFSDWGEYVAEDGTVTADTTHKKYGDQSAKLTAGSTGTINARITQTISVNASSQYRLIYWIKTDGTNSARLQIYDITNTTDIFATDIIATLSTSWIKQSLTFTTNVGTASISLRFICPNAYNAFVYFDGVSLFPL